MNVGRVVLCIIVGTAIGAPATAGDPEIFVDGFEVGHALEWSDSRTGPGHCDSPLLLDDLEDGDLGICHHPLRYGTWFTFDDGTPGSTIVLATSPVVGGAPASSSALHLGGDPFTNWGAGTGFFLDGRDGVSQVDLSTYSGISFWARSSENSTLVLKVPTWATIPAGGSCSSCNDHFQMGVQASTTWQQYTVNFADLTQQGWGDPAALDLATCTGVEWHTGTRMDPWGVWIDEVALVP